MPRLANVQVLVAVPDLYWAVKVLDPVPAPVTKMVPRTVVVVLEADDIDWLSLALTLVAEKLMKHVGVLVPDVMSAWRITRAFPPAGTVTVAAGPAVVKTP